MYQLKVVCGLAAWSIALLLMLLLQLTSTQRATCRWNCIPLSQCTKLHHLLRNPTKENIAALQSVTCTFERDPKVCCPQSLLPRKCGDGPSLDRIIGGTPAPLGSHPWLALLGYLRPGAQEIEFLCGGSIISELYVLTAAHCLHDSVLEGTKLSLIRLGEWNTKTDPDCEKTLQGDEKCVPPAQNFTAEEIITHPDYNTRVQFSDDIGLIRLNKPIDLSAGIVNAICLPPQNLDIKRISERRGSWAAGWGVTENGSVSNILYHVGLPIVQIEQCKTFDIFSGQLVDEQICAGGRAGQDSCRGDSGGPLIMSGPQGPPFLQIGLVSYGPSPCGARPVPGVYTSISHYRNWIENNMKP